MIVVMTGLETLATTVIDILKTARRQQQSSVNGGYKCSSLILYSGVSELMVSLVTVMPGIRCMYVCASLCCVRSILCTYFWHCLTNVSVILH